jgi:predicted Fe-S protein YdhL (DUF1289 family)
MGKGGQGVRREGGLSAMTAPADEARDDVPSPCVRNCCLDHDDVCMGCYRTLSEICAWHEAPDSEKLEILIRCRLRYRQRVVKPSPPLQG